MTTVADSRTFTNSIQRFVGDPTESIYEIFDLQITEPLGKEIECPA